MMVDPATVGLVVANFLAWGHWPICAKLGSAPPQPFGVLMVLAQAASAWLACLAHGAEFVDALVQDSASPLAIFCVVSGGAVLAVGDFSAFAAAERLGVAVGGPVCFSCMLMTGSIGDYLLEGSANPPLLLAGIVGCLCAVLADSQSHATKAHPVEQTGLARADSAAAMEVGVQPTPAQQELGDLGSTAPVTAATKTTGASLDELPPQQQSKRRSDFALGMVVAVGGGVIGGLWTVLSTLASHVHEMRPLVLLFYFHVGELLFIVPVVLVYGGLFGGTTRARVLWRMMRVLTRRQVLWTLASGLCIALGYLFYFGTKGRVPRPVAFGFGCAAGSTSMLYGLLCFREYVGAPLRKKALLLIALLLYPSSIALIAASMG